MCLSGSITGATIGIGTAGGSNSRRAMCQMTVMILYDSQRYIFLLTSNPSPRASNDSLPYILYVTLFLVSLLDDPEIPQASIRQPVIR
jgi:hypothetical protein